MRILVKAESQTVQLIADRQDSVAALKAAYQDAARLEPRKRDYIVFLYKGKELEDEKLLGEYGVIDGSVIVHIEPMHEPYRAVNYRLLAVALKKRRRHEEENARMMRQQNIWAADESGQVHHLGVDSSIVSRKIPSRKTEFGKSKINLGREFSNQVSVRIGGSNFHVLPSMEGRWNGECESVPPSDEGTQVCSTELLYRDEEGVWNQRYTRTAIDGFTTTQHFWLKPVADGILKVETDDPSLRSCDIIMAEHGLNLLLITATAKLTGRTIYVETLTLIDSSRRLRTVQRFDESGAFRFVYVMNEQRVVDAVSGAVERFDPYL